MKKQNMSMRKNNASVKRVICCLSVKSQMTLIDDINAYISVTKDKSKMNLVGMNFINS